MVGTIPPELRQSFGTKYKKIRSNKNASVKYSSSKELLAPLLLLPEEDEEEGLSLGERNVVIPCVAVVGDAVVAIVVIVVIVVVVVVVVVVIVVVVVGVVGVVG